MSWLSDRWRDVKRGLSSDEAKLALGLGIGGYGFLGKAAMNKFLTSSMLKNMAKRYATSYLTSTAMGKPHAHRGATASALWSLPFQAWKNFGMTQDLMGGPKGTNVLREGTDTPWWQLMLGQGKESDPELGFMDMFTKDVPIRGKSGADEGILAALGLGTKGDITGYKKGFDMLGMMPEVIGHSQAGWTPRELEEQGEDRSRRQQAFYNEMMQNPYYDDDNMYRWPGWGIGAKRGGIMQALQGGGDFMEDLVAADTNGDMIEAGEEIVETPSGITEEDFEMMETGSEGIPPEILEGIVNQRDPLMQQIMEMIMNMIAPTLGEDEEMPMMGPSGMGEMGDYLGPQSEMGVEEQGDLGLGMQGGGEYAQPTGRLLSDVLSQSSEMGMSELFEMAYMKYLRKMMEGNPHLDPARMLARERQPTGRLLSDVLSQSSEDVEGLGMQSGGDYTRGAHVMGPGGPKSDSVNAKLSDGEFVMTAKAVQNAGGGDRREGAKRMYNMMNRLDPQSARPGEEPTVV